MTNDFFIRLSHILFLSIGYILSIYIGYYIMKNKESYNLFHYQVIYNISCIIINLYICIAMFKATIVDKKFSFACNNSYPSEIKYQDILDIEFVFFLSKIWEFQDTWIMILRKNNRQISFLHVYHHSTVFIIVWLSLIYSNGSDEYLFIILNSFVHVFMYGYYLLSSFKIKVFYKAYLTTLQLIQFFIVFIQSMYMFLQKEKCGFPIELTMVCCLYIISMIILFTHFYLRNYKKNELHIE